MNNDTIILVVLPSRTHYVVPPIGLGYLVSALRRKGFKNITILDCLKERLTTQALIKRLVELRPAVIGFQVFSYDFPVLQHCVTAMKRLLPSSVIILGGPHVSATPDLILHEVAEADYAFAGEGEVGLPLLMEIILRGRECDFSQVPGLVFRASDRNTIIQNPRAVISNLDELGFPAWDLIRPDHYPDSPQGAFYQRFPIAPLSTTRGCPYRCTFCGSGVNMGRQVRLRTISNVLDEMELLIHEYGVAEFHIIDDMFNFKRARVKEFCEGLMTRGMDISYTFPNGLRLNHLDSEVLELMKATGAYAFTVGIESGSQVVLDRMHKDLNLAVIEDKVRLIVEAGLEPCGFFILGFPDESESDIRATIDFAKRLPLKRAHFSNFLPLPGTEATRNLLEKGEIDRIDWHEMFYAKVPYAPRGLTKKRLKALQRRAYLEFHLRPRILKGLLSEIRSINHFFIIFRRAWDYLVG
ncbi:B12-binding domain-containing radical SAM protein [bacterium]|nr:B12-binding domain-containing radical SAM protein [bacterium]